MDLRKQMDVNLKIMRLIKWKYIDEFPVGYNTPEANYYRHLKEDVAKANRYLERAGRK
ncbi:hypothetical protein ES708_11541 [subsurface metagenome]